MKLEGKRALITDANRGIGRAIAEAFAREGAALILTARDPDSSEPVSEARRLQLDVTDQASIDAAKREAGERRHPREQRRHRRERQDPRDG